MIGGHVVERRETWNACRILVGKPLEKYLFEDSDEVDDIKLAVTLSAVSMGRQWNSLRIVSSAVGYISVNRVQYAVSTPRYVVGC